MAGSYGVDWDGKIKLFVETRNGRYLVKDPMTGEEGYRDNGPKRYLSTKEKAFRNELKNEKDMAKRNLREFERQGGREKDLSEFQKEEAKYLQRKEEERSGERDKDDDDDEGPPYFPPISAPEADYRAAQDREAEFYGPNPNRRQALEDGVMPSPEVSVMSPKQQAAMKLQRTMKKAMGDKVAQPSFDKAVEKASSVPSGISFDDIGKVLPLIMGSGLVTGAKKVLEKLPIPSPVLPSLPIIIVPPTKKDDDKIA